MQYLSIYLIAMNFLQINRWHNFTTRYNGADIVICPEVSFDYLNIVRRRRMSDQRAPVIIFIGMDALEAATLRSDVRVTSKQSVVEIITQP